MNLELNDDQVNTFVTAALSKLEEEYPADKKLAKAIKRILSYTMRPSEWSDTYTQDYLEYVEGKKSNKDIIWEDPWVVGMGLPTNIRLTFTPEEQRIYDLKR